MNIWEWVEKTATELNDSGNGRLANIIYDLPGATVGHRFEEAEALAVEGLGLARSARLPWVEVFLRHWHLQSRVANGGEGATALSDAVAALEAAHREEAKDCPQSVCAVQDLAICYGNVDAKGWAPERLAVADEALAAINPTWPCFQCISAERSSALIALGRPDEALATLDAARRATRDMDGEYTTIISRLGALLAAERWKDCADEAARYIADSPGDVEPKRASARVRQAYALARMGEAAGAAAVLPPSPSLAPPDLSRWAKVTQLLIAAGERENDWRLGSTLRSMAADLEGLGAWRRAFEVALVHGDLAVARGRASVAGEALDLARRMAANLRDPASAAADLDALAERVAAMSSSDVAARLPASGAALLEAMEQNEDPDPEEDIELLTAAHAAWPEDRTVAVRLAIAKQASGDEAGAIAVLDPIVTGAEEKGDEATTILVGMRVLQNDDAEIEALADRLGQQSPTITHWLRAQHAARRADWERCVAECRAIIEREPEVGNARRLLASALRRLGQFDDAVRTRLEVHELGSAKEGDDWDLLVDASAARRWDVVRDAAGRVGIDLPPGDGPDFAEGHGFVAVYEGDAEELALRIGPATARIVSVSPGQPQRHGDVIVFDPTPLDPFDPDDQGEDFVRFAHVADLAPGGFIGYRLHGVTPPEEEVASLRDALDAVGAALWVYQSGDYEIDAPDGSDATWFSGMVAVAAGGESAVHKLLGESTKWLGWPDLARAAGDDAAAAEHEALIESLD